MADKKPLFEGTVADLLKEWFSTGAPDHWLDKGSRHIIVYQAPKAWELINERNEQNEQNGHKASSRS